MNLLWQICVHYTFDNIFRLFARGMLDCESKNMFFTCVLYGKYRSTKY